VWADVIKASGINVQIVLGNGNLGLTTLTKTRSKRRGGAAWRLEKKRGGGERGAKSGGQVGPEKNISAVMGVGDRDAIVAAR
jgi:hypothetical protein